jgi:AraC-like DNA-binding protein
MKHSEISYKMAETSLHQWASVKSELMWIHDGPVSEVARDQDADHRKGYYLWILHQGHVDVTSKGSPLSAKAGDLLISPQEVIHQSFSADARILSLHFQCKWPSGDNLFHSTDGYVLSQKEYPQLVSTAHSLCKIVQQQFPQAGTDLPLLGADYSLFLGFQRHFMRLLTEFTQLFLNNHRVLAQTSHYDPRVLRAIQFMNDATPADGLPVEDLEKVSGSGRAYLDKLFLKETGASVRGYWDRRREDLSRQDLHNTTLSIKEVSFKMGFKQASHFTKWFQKRTGMTPGAYQKKKDNQWIY